MTIGILILLVPLCCSQSILGGDFTQNVGFKIRSTPSAPESAAALCNDDLRTSPKSGPSYHVWVLRRKESFLWSQNEAFRSQIYGTRVFWSYSVTSGMCDPCVIKRLTIRAQRRYDEGLHVRLRSDGRVVCMCVHLKSPSHGCSADSDGITELHVFFP